MVSQIRKNERRGRKIERQVLQCFGKDAILANNRYTPYDIKTCCLLVEVKSCKIKTINEKNGKSYRKGRFVINHQSHQNLKTEAEKQNKSPWYHFIVISRNSKTVLKRFSRTWANVDNILKKIKPITRKDGLIYYLITYTKLIGGK